MPPVLACNVLTPRQLAFIAERLPERARTTPLFKLAAAARDPARSARRLPLAGP